MLHPFALVLVALLAGSAVLGGLFPSIAFLLYFLVWKCPRSPTPWLVLLLVWLCAAAHILTVVVVNIITTSPAIRKRIFVEGYKLAASLGIFEAGNSEKGWMATVVCIPSALLLVYIPCAQRLLRRRIRMRRSFSALVVCCWALAGSAASLLAPTVASGFFLVVSMTGVLALTYGSGQLIHPGEGLSPPSLGSRLAVLLFRVTVLTTVVAGSLLIGLICAAQNAYVASVLADLDPAYGLARLFDMPLGVSLRLHLQVPLMALTVVVARILSAYRRAAPRFDALLSGRSYRQSLTMGRGTADHGPVVPLCHRELIRNAPEHRSGSMPQGSLGMSSASVAAAGGRSSWQSRQSFTSSTGPPRRGVSPSMSEAETRCSNSTTTIRYDIVGGFIAILHSAASKSATVVHALSCFVPLTLMAVSIVVFPCVPTLSLLPAMMIGLVMRKVNFKWLLYPTIPLFAAVVLAQFFVVATEPLQSELVLRLFLSSGGGTWSYLGQVVCNEALYLVLLLSLFSARDARRTERDSNHEYGPTTAFAAASPSSVGWRGVKLPYLSQSRVNSAAAAAAGHDVSGALDGSDAFPGVVAVPPEASAGHPAAPDPAAGAADLVACATEVLGAERVAELISEAPSTPISTVAFARLFRSYVGRFPKLEERRCLHTPNIQHSILEARLRLVQRSAPIQCWKAFAAIMISHALTIVLFFIFVAATFVRRMDVLHLIEMVLLLLHYAVPRAMERNYHVVLGYTMMLTAFEVVFAYVVSLVEVGPMTILGFSSTTIGLTPVGSQYELIPYFVSVFALATLYDRLQMCNSWSAVISLYEWRRVTETAVAKRWKRRITLAVGTAVLVCLGVLLPRSLVVEGFLILFLLQCVVLTMTGSASTPLLVVWFFTAAYGAIVLCVTTFSQFDAVRTALADFFETVDECPNTTTCLREIGIVPQDDHIFLTFFLAPWLLAFATAMAHLQSMREARNRSMVLSEMDTLQQGPRIRDERAVPLAAASNRIQRESYRRSVAPSVHLLGLGREPAYVPLSSLEEPSSEGHGQPTLCDVADGRSSDSPQEQMVQQGFSPVGVISVSGALSAEEPAVPLRLASTSTESSDAVASPHREQMTTAAQSKGARFDGKDQLFFRIAFLCLVVLEKLGEMVAFFGADYGNWIVWMSFLFAALQQKVLLSSAYILFFVVNYTHISVLLYCILHLLVVYSYQFWFVGEVNWIDKVRGVDMARLIGLEKSESLTPSDLVIGPVVVFYAVLFCVSTRGANRQERRREKTEGPETTRWATVFHTQLFWYAGYEAFLLSALIALSITCRWAVGVLIGVATVFAYLAGRKRFHLFYVRLFLYVLLAVVFLYQIVLRLNAHERFIGLPNESAIESPAAQATFLSMKPHSKNATTPTVASPSPEMREMWHEWLFAGSTASLIVLFLCIGLLHVGGEQANDSHVHLALLREQFNGATTLVEHVRLHKDRSLHLLTEARLNEVVPIVTETNPPSCLGLVTRGIIWLITHTYPVPIITFASGASSTPSLVNLALLMAALVQVMYFEALQWSFYYSWHLIAVAYYSLAIFPVLLNIPYVAAFLLDHRTTASVFGVVHDGSPLGFSAVWVALLFAVAVQTRMYDDFRFESFVRRLYRATSVQQSKHESLWRRLGREYEIEQLAADLRDKKLRAKLDEVRFTSTYLAETWAAAGLQSSDHFDPTGASPRPLSEKTPHCSSPTTAPPSRRRQRCPGSPFSDDGTHGGSQYGPLVTAPSAAPALYALRAPTLELSRRSGDAELPVACERDEPTDAAAPQAHHGAEAAGEKPLDDPTLPPDTQPLSEGDADSVPSSFHSHHSEDRGGSVCSCLQAWVVSALETMSDALRRYTFNPPAYTRGNYRNPFSRFVVVMLRVGERHTDFFVVLTTLVNFMITGCFWEILPLFTSVVIATTYNPFAPRALYRFLFAYVAIGIFLKAVLSIVSTQETYSERFLRFLSWAIIHVTDNGDLFGSQRIHYGYVMIDFIVFAFMVLHQYVCLANGVYSAKELLEIRLADMAVINHFFSEGEQRTDDLPPPAQLPEGQGDYAWAGEDSDDGGYDDADDFAEETTRLRRDKPPGYPGERREVGGIDRGEADDAYGLVIGEGDGDDVESGSPLELPNSVCCSPLGMVENARRTISEFLRNATNVPGVGRDWYALYGVTEAIGLLVFLFGYYKMSPDNEGSLQDNVRRNLLPGNLVIVVLLTLVILLVDRMLYVKQHMVGKLVFNIFCGGAYCLLYWIWRNYVSPPSLTAGNIFFVLKCLVVYISALQLRLGFPRHRRHDPFTHMPQSLVRWALYQVYRGVPFLWEARVVTDWTVQRTSLRLMNYLKVEDLYDTIYRRKKEICDARGQQPYLGTAIKMQAKITEGVFRLALIVVVLIAPLIYYSTFNPAMTANEVSTMRVSASFVNSQSFFTSSVYESQEYSGNLAQWLSRTRPSLAAEGIISRVKGVQMLDLSSCSNDLWPISPQGLRVLQSNLRAAAANESAMNVMLQVELSTGATYTMSSTTRTISSRWPIPWNTASELADLVSGEEKGDDGSATTTAEPTVDAVEASPSTESRNSSSSSGGVSETIVRLPNFYSPFIFNEPDVVQMYTAVDRKKNTMDCSVTLRKEEDPVLHTMVRYWCLKCNAMFTSGNTPVSDVALYPEWPCLTGNGADCDAYNFENRSGNVSYVPVPMYYVIFSDQVVEGVSFLQSFGLVALYTTFVLAIGRFLRTMFTDKAKNVLQSDMADPSAVSQLLELISIARECDELMLEQSIYFELIDLLRSPEKLLRVTGYNRGLYNNPRNEYRVPEGIIPRDEDLQYLVDFPEVQFPYDVTNARSGAGIGPTNVAR